MVATELERERDALEKSGNDIAEGQNRIDRQIKLIADLRAKGLDTGEGERLLALLGDTLTHWEQHHEMIVERIAYLEAKHAAASAAAKPSQPGGFT